ncbi:MAG: response regulator [Proteobacteria bacterium]|jgi:CheY-like chemotaxis protein|nr:response regulator [Pseudomonadota bacterium]
MSQTRRPGKILLVDDCPSFRRFAARLFEPLYDIKFAASAAEAITALGKSAFDLVLLDINLGKGEPTGIDCLRAFAETGQRGAACMLTALLSPDLMHEALLAGADDYLLKQDEARLPEEVARLVALGNVPRQRRPRYESIADPGLLRSLRLEPAQVRVLIEMVELGYPPDKELADALGCSTKALVERIARIEVKFGAIDRRRLVRYLTVLSGFVSRSRLEWGSGAVDRSSLVDGATEFDVPGARND